MKKQRLITKQFTFTGYLLNGLWVLMIIVVVSGFLPILIGHYGTIDGAWLLTPLAALLGVLVWACVKTSINSSRIRHRNEQVLKYAGQNTIDYQPKDFTVDTSFVLMSLADLEEVRDAEYKNVLTTKDWTYADYSYTVYRKTNKGDYKEATVYYGVITAKLPRNLPNVFFDSLKARKRQFRFHFAGSQRHSLEGDFDTYFVTYFPEDYTIDSMSFISPDVMLALKDAHDYDIEIIGDRLFLYGPLYEVSKQLPDMVQKLTKIKKQLLDNILTYRDERVPYEVGRQHVAVTGMSLKRSVLLKRITTIVIIGAVLVWLAAKAATTN